MKTLIILLLIIASPWVQGQEVCGNGMVWRSDTNVVATIYAVDSISRPRRDTVPVYMLISYMNVKYTQSNVDSVMYGYTHERFPSIVKGWRVDIYYSEWASNLGEEYLNHDKTPLGDDVILWDVHPKLY